MVDCGLRGILVFMDEFELIVKNLINPATLLGAIFYAVLIGILAWLAGRLLRAALHRFVERGKYAVDRTAINFLGQVAQVVVFILAFLTYAHLVPALQRLGTAWLAGVSVASVVVGMAAQNTLANFIAGLSLLLYRPFNLGDRMQVQAPSGLESGVVEGLNLGYTILRTADNRRVVIPNSVMAGQACINLSMTDARVPASVPVGIGNDVPVEKARQLLIDMARRDSKVLEVTGCPVTAVSNSGVTLTLMVRCADVQSATNFRYDFMEAVKKRFDSEAIKMA